MKTINNQQVIADRIKQLCDEKNISVNKAMTDSGAGARTYHNIQSGSSPSSEKLAKIADYLNVSVDYLLGRTEIRTPQSSDDIKFALFNGSEGVTDEMYEEVLKFAEFVKSKYKK